MRRKILLPLLAATLLSMSGLAAGSVPASAATGDTLAVSTVDTIPTSFSSGSVFYLDLDVNMSNVGSGVAPDATLTAWIPDGIDAVPVDRPNSGSSADTGVWDDAARTITWTNVHADGAVGTWEVRIVFTATRDFTLSDQAKIAWAVVPSGDDVGSEPTFGSCDQTQKTTTCGFVFAPAGDLDWAKATATGVLNNDAAWSSTTKVAAGAEFLDMAGAVSRNRIRGGKSLRITVWPDDNVEYAGSDNVAAAASTWSWDPDSRDLTYDIGTFPGNIGMMWLPVTWRVAAGTPAGTKLTTFVTISNINDPMPADPRVAGCPAGASCASNTFAVAGPDLRVKVHKPDFGTGDTKNASVEWAVEVANEGNAAASDVTVRFGAPGDATGLSVFDEGTHQDLTVGNDGAVNVGTVGSGVSTTLRAKVKVPVTALTKPVVVKAWVQADSDPTKGASDASQTNDTIGDDTDGYDEVQATYSPELVLVEAQGGDTSEVSPGAKARFTVRVWNTNPVAISDARVVADIVEWGTVVDASVPYTMDSGVVKLSVGDVPAGGSVDVTVDVQTNADESWTDPKPLVWQFAAADSDWTSACSIVVDRAGFHAAGVDDAASCASVWGVELADDTPPVVPDDPTPTIDTGAPAGPQLWLAGLGALLAAAAAAVGTSAFRATKQR